MLKISVRSNVKEFTRGLTRIQKKQVPFATARALTWTAQDVQKAIMERIPRVFNVTKKWWLKQQPTGIKVRPAKKTHLASRVYTEAHFADLQEDGGTKRPRQSKSLLVPSNKVPKSRRKSGGAAAMLKGKKTFSNRKGIYRRKGPKRNQTVELLFARTKTAHIRPRFGFKRTAVKTVRARFKRNFARSLSKALETAKR